MSDRQVRFLKKKSPRYRSRVYVYNFVFSESRYGTTTGSCLNETVAKPFRCYDFQ